MSSQPRPVRAAVPRVSWSQSIVGLVALASAACFEEPTESTPVTGCDAEVGCAVPPLPPPPPMNIDDGGSDGGCVSDDECNDELFCNGIERCEFDVEDAGSADSPRRGVCRATPPCSATACDETKQLCTCDEDGDGLRAWYCGGPDDDADNDGFRHDAEDEMTRDCDDRNRYYYPGAVERCDPMGIDEDCDLTTVAGRTNAEDPRRDRDGDGYIDIACINKDPETGEVYYAAGANGPDCNDENPEVHPGPDIQDNTCDERDNDCDGKTDEQAPTYDYCPDADSDGWPAAEPIVETCSPPTGYKPCRSTPDCDDSVLTGPLVRPDFSEVCDGVENDCNPETPQDEALPGKLLIDEPSFSDGTTAVCEDYQGKRTWTLRCPEDRLWCDDTKVAHGCETDATRLSSCRSCQPTNCAFSCGSAGCDEIGAVTVGREFACAVTLEGRAACWGRGADGRLGNDETRSAAIPQPVVGLAGAMAVSAGTAHACAIVGLDHAAYCWGSNLDSRLANFDVVDGSSVPLPVAGLIGGTDVSLRDVRRIAAGDSHTCAVLGDSRIACWGQSAGGRLGNGMTQGTSLPRPVSRNGISQVTGLPAKFPVRDARDVVVGDEHSCLLTVGEDGGQVECWGSNAAGQLGADTTTVVDSAAPVVVAGVGRATQITAGAYHTCALASGRVFCWGLNSRSQLGRRSSNLDYQPREIPNLPDVVEVAAGDTFTCARDAEGGLYCWGNEEPSEPIMEVAVAADGGADDSPEDDTSVIVSKIEVPAVAQIAAKEFVCTRSEDGRVFCWGDNFHGQLGRARTDLEPQLDPKQIVPLRGSVR